LRERVADTAIRVPTGNPARESGIWVIESYTYWHAVNDDVSGKLQLAQMDTGYIAAKAEFHVAELLS